MYRRLKSFLGKNDDSQYGFKSNMDNKLYTSGIFIDLQKAFDTVHHSILLEKLNHCGIRGIINDWFASYLVGRKSIRVTMNLTPLTINLYRNTRNH